jgi:RNA polymerase sigma-70 factor (ECF subfamily)
MMSRELAHLSDEAVVALVSRSDELALAELYDRYAPAAYNLARRVVRDPALAEDAVQEAFLAVWRGADRFVPERASASAWLLTIVHRRAVDLVRREERRRGDVLEEERAPESRAPSAEHAVWLNLERERIRNALDLLPDRQRELLELAYYGGFTQSQLAVRLGRPIGTIKSQMFAALAGLRDILEPTMEEGSWKTS